MKSAVLFLIFNRPDTTEKVFEAIRAARPPKLYVAADGPRSNRPGEHIKCEETRKIATKVDWPCEVKTLFRTQNLGCKLGVSSGIDWFFEQEEEGIIIEDDILPLPGFFLMCDELLHKYRNEPRIGMISGCNLISSHFKCPNSYFFSKYNHIWGWASWRRAWSKYDVTMKDWPEWHQKGGIKSISDKNKYFELYWEKHFKSVFQNKIDTWDYQWTFACWRHEMLSILPAYNQINNLGFGVDATHTTDTPPTYVVESIPKNLEFPLSHPKEIYRVPQVDSQISNIVFNISLLNTLKGFLKNLSEKCNLK